MSPSEFIFGRGRWIQTSTARRYYPVHPRPSEVCIEDIGHHLSMLVRYTGAVSQFYSVAEHSWHVSYLVPSHMALKGLLHDSPESYINDLSRPLKHHWLLRGYRRIEQRNWLAIALHFGLTPDMPPEIHAADNQMLTVERAALLPPMPWSTKYPGPPRRVTIECWTPPVAEAMFLKRFHELTTMRPQHRAHIGERSARGVDYSTVGFA